MDRRLTVAVAVILVVFIVAVLAIYPGPKTTDEVQCTSTVFLQFGGEAGSGSYTSTYTTSTNATARVGYTTTIATTPLTTGALEHSDITCTFISK